MEVARIVAPRWREHVRHIEAPGVGRARRDALVKRAGVDHEDVVAGAVDEALNDECPGCGAEVRAVC